ncbi:DUF6299 family protein [Streptomyces sp. NPDC047718]|uniref:DUF6299 family protein n=1 Tax=Streptomyces sp. NPDC047718 TaxID=3155479 RepID=UPI0033DB68FA
MRTSGSRITLAAFSALAATTAFTAPAAATAFNQTVSVRSEAHIDADGTITLSGTYRCEQPSPDGTIQIKAALVQGDVHLGIGAGRAVCDGKDHDWHAHATLAYTPQVHAGPARVTAELQELHLSGLMPSSLDTVAADEKAVEVVDHR